MDRHVMECLGMTRVVIQDGKVVEVGEPKVRFCPLFKKYRNIDEITSDVVRENIEFRIGSFGMCCNDRDTRMKDFLSFGISEIMSSSLRNGSIDVAVTAADGCGTFMTSDPELVQGMGGRISGICETSPLPKVISDVGADNVLDPATAAIDMIAGVRKAKDRGYARIAVTVSSAKDAVILRNMYGNDLIIIAVHTSGTSEEDAVILFDTCDIITACASRTLRDECRNRDAVIAGNKVPVYGVSANGKKLVRMRLEETGKAEYDGEDPEEPPYPLI